MAATHSATPPDVITFSLIPWILGAETRDFPYSPARSHTVEQEPPIITWNLMKMITDVWILQQSGSVLSDFSICISPLFLEVFFFFFLLQLLFFFPAFSSIVYVHDLFISNCMVVSVSASQLSPIHSYSLFFYGPQTLFSVDSLCNRPWGHFWGHEDRMLCSYSRCSK